MLEGHDLEGHVAGGQDEDADPANIHMDMKPAYCAASSQAPFKEGRLTRPSRRGGWRVATQAARTGLWMDRQKLRGRQKDFQGTRLSHGTLVARGVLLYRCCVFGWRSGGGRRRGQKLLRSSETCPRGGSLLGPRGTPVSSPRDILIEVQT